MQAVDMPDRKRVIRLSGETTPKTFVEMTVKVADIGISGSNLAGLNWPEYISTWRMVDEGFDDVEDLPLFQTYVRYKQVHGVSLDPRRYLIHKLKLYSRIKLEGFDPYKEQRITCSFSNSKFYVNNGHHRVSMLKHWGVEEIPVLVYLPKSKHVEVSPLVDPLAEDFPEYLAKLISEDSYVKYQPVIGYSNTRLKMFQDSLRGFESIQWEDKRVLEVGPCYGFYSFWLESQGAKVTAVEFDDDRHRICQGLKEYYGSDVEFFRGDVILHMMMRKRQYDVLFLQNVLHHLIRENGISLVFKYIDKWNIPEMTVTMGLTLGRWMLNASKEQIPHIILENTNYVYAKKIGTWGNRDMYYFSRSNSPS